LAFEKTIPARYSNTMGNLVTTLEFAQVVGVDVSRVRALASARRIRGARKLGGRWFIPKDAEILPGKRGPQFQKLGHRKRKT
jgi:hypothetical protein